ncbi:MAG TPA: N-methyl-D-aspartate receptor NMDAR2C subunit [Rhodocyclaceae bacterium]|jgi:predicted metal-dependent HD superfamily phosphohydrolase|nr:N-methyl-D-aspartate receptor NMDAR2C subunit [Rhodocyclaceae bacterium]
MQNIFTRSWSRITLALAAPGLADKGEALQARYAEKWRKYHTLQHLDECLNWFEKSQHLVAQPVVVETALWFHDVIYLPRQSDNENQSAELATKLLSADGVADDVCQQVANLVMVTRHDGVPATPDEQLLVDIDLSILGAAPQRFSEYEAQVREEYAFVPGPLFRYKRRQILEAFQSRPRLYSTDFFYARLEQQARHNLEQAIAACG